MVCAVVFGSTFVVNRYIGRDWMPQDDQNELSINLEMPEGSSLEATEKTTLEIARKVAKVDGVITVIPATNNGFMDRVNMAQMTVLLKPRNERLEITEMGAKVRAITREYPFARPRVTYPNVLGGARHLRTDSCPVARSRHAPARGICQGSQRAAAERSGADRR